MNKEIIKKARSYNYLDCVADEMNLKAHIMEQSGLIKPRFVSLNVWYILRIMYWLDLITDEIVDEYFKNK